MTSSLVGSEMCIRDRETPLTALRVQYQAKGAEIVASLQDVEDPAVLRDCLLYTSDAADDM
eukprot:9157270-Prorocentrum_lima.AAC.1